MWLELFGGGGREIGLGGVVVGVEVGDGLLVGLPAPPFLKKQAK